MHAMARATANNDAGAEKADASDYALDDPARIGAGPRVNRQNRECRAEADKAKRAHARRLAVQIAIETEYDPGEGRSAQPQCDFEGAHDLQFSGSGRTAEGGQARSARGFLEVECECDPPPVAGVLSKAD